LALKISEEILTNCHDYLDSTSDLIKEVFTTKKQRHLAFREDHLSFEKTSPKLELMERKYSALLWAITNHFSPQFTGKGVEFLYQLAQLYERKMHSISDHSCPFRVLGAHFYAHLASYGVNVMRKSVVRLICLIFFFLIHYTRLKC
jgi:hypothetical protein